MFKLMCKDINAILGAQTILISHPILGMQQFRKIYKILFRILTVVKPTCVLNNNEAKTLSKLPLLPDRSMSIQYLHDCKFPAYKWLKFTCEVINLLFAC